MLLQAKEKPNKHAVIVSQRRMESNLKGCEGFTEDVAKKQFKALGSKWGHYVEAILH